MTLLGSNRRSEWIQSIGRALDKRYLQRLPPRDHTPDQIEQRLRRHGAPSNCRLISEDSDLDGVELSLADALEATVGRGMVTLLSCVDGELAYLEDEGPGQRFIVSRPA
jgi:hypothetical protein